MKGSIQHSSVDLVETFRLEEFLPYRLAVAAEGVSRMIARQYLDPSGVGMPEWRLLAAVGRQGVMSPTEAADRTAMGTLAAYGSGFLDDQAVRPRALHGDGHLQSMILRPTFAVGAQGFRAG
jgi:hypothetical protein